ncbi:phosphotransferase [Candidatus Frankia alpina]|uniref:phosphotransferase n=1 Tax=Candidatus Frankia alpina TaxID=2699483 RepID=UPI0013D1C4B7|nr:phosphotransferase [Candidatus Frankia alpina]
MHTDKIDIDAPQVRRLIAAQFPQWTRLPRIPAAAEQVDKEQRWLSRLAPLLPLAVPVPLGRGRPDQGYPWTWSVYRWLDGESLLAEPVTDPPHLAVELARVSIDLGLFQAFS